MKITDLSVETFILGGMNHRIYRQKSRFTAPIHKLHLYQAVSSDKFMQLGSFACYLCVSIFFKINFYENIFQEYHLSNRLDPDQARNFSGLNWVQTVHKSLSADNTIVQIMFTVVALGPVTC